jgi:hypothetical protein
LFGASAPHPAQRIILSILPQLRTAAFDGIAGRKAMFDC